MMNFVMCNQDHLHYNLDFDWYGLSLIFLSFSAFPVSGLGSRRLDRRMRGLLAGARGPFTPSQFIELERQILIYKCIENNEPLPSNLLNSIRNSRSPSVLTATSTGYCRPTSLRCGYFQPGSSGDEYPEPGRCRRTDGKKWRCPREAIPNDIHCERHKYRGCQRSRKLVEQYRNHAAQVKPIITPSPSALVISGCASSRSSYTNPLSTQNNRMLVSKETANAPVGGSQNLSVRTLDKKPIGGIFPIPMKHKPFEGSSSQSDFEVSSFDFLLNSPSTPILENKNLSSSLELHEEGVQPNSALHFLDDCPKMWSNCSTNIWPEVENMQLDKTQLSMSIPMASSDFSSSPSLTQGKLTLSPLKSPQASNPIVGGVADKVSQEQVIQTPISWEAFMGGNLGEFLTSSDNGMMEQDWSSSLNLMNNGLDLGPHLSSSPTHVLASLPTSTTRIPTTEESKDYDSISSWSDDLFNTF